MITIIFHLYAWLYQFSIVCVCMCVCYIYICYVFTSVETCECACIDLNMYACMSMFLCMFFCKCAILCICIIICIHHINLECLCFCLNFSLMTFFSSIFKGPIGRSVLTEIVVPLTMFLWSINASQSVSQLVSLSLSLSLSIHCHLISYESQWMILLAYKKWLQTLYSCDFNANSWTIFIWNNWLKNVHIFTCGNQGQIKCR